MKGGGILKKGQITVISAVLFFVVTIPFREFFGVMEVMGIRPSALPPVFGLMMGISGVLGCALGNLAADILSGYAPLICVLGLVTQFTYGLLPLLMWNAVNELGKSEPRIIRLDNVKNVIRYTVIVLINAAVIVAFISSIMQSIGVSQFISTSTLMLFLNNFVFCVVLGVPIIIFMSIKRLRHSKTYISLNERLVLVFLLSGVVSGGLMGIFAYSELSRVITDPVTMWMRVYTYIAANLLGFYIISIAFLWYSEKNITMPIESITQIAKNFIDSGQEKQDSWVIVHECEKLIGKRREIGILAEAFKKMVLDLDVYIGNLTVAMAENERVATELNVARQIQADMLPNIFPAFPERDEFEIYASMQPAKEVGGDFYDFFFIDSDHLCVVIADVSGKGVPAALFMVIAKTLINNRARSGEEPEEVFTNVSSQLREGNKNAMFVTAWMGVIEISTGKIRYVNAGHNPPLVKKACNSFEYFKTQKSLMLAGMRGVKYKQSVFQLDRGDVLYLYTDGVIEANNKTGEMYGKNRLLETLNSAPNLVPADILAYVKSDVTQFAGSEPQFDDITMLALLIK